MRVKAIQLGFDGVRRIRPGQEFEVKEGMKGSWFEPIDPPFKPAELPKPQSKRESKSDE